MSQKTYTSFLCFFYELARVGTLFANYRRCRNSVPVRPKPLSPLIIFCCFRFVRIYACIAVFLCFYCLPGWLGSRVVRVLDSGAEGPWFKSQPRRCRVTVLGKLFTPIVPMFTKQKNWQQPSSRLRG